MGKAHTWRWATLATIMLIVLPWSAGSLAAAPPRPDLEVSIRDISRVDVDSHKVTVRVRSLKNTFTGSMTLNVSLGVAGTFEAMTSCTPERLCNVTPAADGFNVTKRVTVSRKTATVQFLMTVPPGATTTVAANVPMVQRESRSANNSASRDHTNEPVPDLALTLGPVPEAVAPGDTIRGNLLISNDGAATSTGDGFIFGALNGTFAEATCTPADGGECGTVDTIPDQIQVRLGAMPPGGAAVIEFAMVAGNDTGMELLVMRNAGTADANASNDAASVAIMVDPAFAATDLEPPPALDVLDVNGDPRSPITGSLAGMAAANWTFALDTPPTNGTVTVEPDGAFTYQATDPTLGGDQFYVLATGPDGEVLPLTVNIRYALDPNSASDDAAQPGDAEKEPPVDENEAVDTGDGEEDTAPEEEIDTDADVIEGEESAPEDDTNIGDEEDLPSEEGQ